MQASEKGSRETHEVRRTIGVRVGGRSARVVKAVLDATLAELARVGYAALRMDDVASAADVNKTTVYRRWPTKAALVAAAIDAVSGRRDPLPDTGDLRADLALEVRRTVRFVQTAEGRAILRLVTTERSDPEVDALARELREKVAQRRSELVTRAQSRGELPASADARLVLDAIFAPVLSRVVRFDEDVDNRTIARIVDLVVTGAEHGGGRVT